ncbi:hypothetical protein AAG906_014663 [Vitis piasezkii]
MATEKRKRKEHVPPTCTVKLPKSRCSEEIHNKPLKRWALGPLDFACRELRYELCGWLISQYDFTYHRLNMETAMLSSMKNMSTK